MPSPEELPTQESFASGLPGVELRLLRYVIAVAEELHFTKASMRLHVATPSLSRQIRQLEQVLGYTLFERKPRAVTLTPAGLAFVAEARHALVYARRAVEAGATIHAGENGVVRVGYTPLLCATLLAQIRHACAQVSAQLHLLFQSRYSITQIEQILWGRLDAGLVVLPAASPELHIDELFQSRLVAAVPENSPLAHSAVIGPAEIVEQPLVCFGKHVNPQLYQDFLERCRKAGFTPNIVHEATTVMEILDSVATGIGIGFIEATIASRFCPRGIVFREIAVPSFVLQIGIAYRDGNCSESLLSFLRVVKQLVRQLSQRRMISDQSRF